MRTCRQCNETKNDTLMVATRACIGGIEKLCRDCQSQNYRMWRQNNIHKIREKNKNYYHNNKERIQETKRLDYENNKEEIIQKSKDYYMKNKQKIKERVSHYKKNNRGRYNALCAKRKLATLQRTPSWTDLEAIKKFYINCPEGYHVDHIIPLQGKLVSGLHTLENLQYLPAIENISKANKFVVGG